MNPVKFFNPTGHYFRFALLLIIFFEILSYLGFLYPLINTLVFSIIILLILIFSLIRLEWGLYILLTELFIGSKGYLFSLNIGGLNLSLRIGLYVVVLAVWIFHFLKERKIVLRSSNLFRPYLILFIFIIFGIINGVLKDNSWNNIFFDANSWLYFVLIFVFVEVINSWEKVGRIFQILLAAVTATALKTLFLLYFFSHHIQFALPSLYRWVRSTGVGEITRWQGDFFRIFFQTQIYSFIAFFVLLGLLMFLYKNDYPKKFWRRLLGSAFFALLVILVSFSRSFWLGVIGSFLVLYFLLIFKFKFSIKKISFFTLFLVIIFFLEIGFITAFINFPLPKTSGGISAASLIEERAKEITEEPGISSRYKLLGPLWQKIKEHPVLGSGFGTTVTYKTEDPRYLVSHPDGLYTTYVFEWGYLDTLTEIGLVGLGVYVWLIWRIIKKSWKVLKESQDKIVQGLSLGLLLALIGVMIVNIASPYLNHPLGIGFLMLSGAIFEVLSQEN